jgi:hypothetical protein
MVGTVDERLRSRDLVRDQGRDLCRDTCEILL